MALSLPDLDRLERDKLVDSRGISFKELRRSLKPNYLRVWFDIVAGYVVLGLIIAGVIWLDTAYPRAFPFIAVGGGLCIGYTLAYTQLFFHEAAHFNLARRRALNDFLADAVLGAITGQSIKAYRVVHMDHHRLLGTTADTEHSYFDALRPRFLIEGLTGVRLLRVILGRRQHVGAKSESRADVASGARRMLALGLLINLAILALAFWSRCWSLFFAWPFGMVVVLPAVTSLRQLLEHRSFDAASSVDYHAVDHGANTRMFGSGPIASTLGGAGFNRHLLHHWDPQLSYTAFPKLEAFLLDTEAAPIIARATTTYGRALIRLMQAP